MRTRSHAALVGALLLAGLARTSLAQAESLGAKRQLVIFYSYRTLMPVNADWGRGICRALAADFPGRVDTNIEYLDFDYVEGLPLPQLLEKMSNLRPDTVDLMLVYDKDALGNHYVTQEVAEQLANVCPVPVVGLYETLRGHGIVGGSLLMVEAQGELAGEMAAHVLQGEQPSDIPAAGLAANRVMFDARQLRRWNLRQDALPAGSIVR